MKLFKTCLRSLTFLISSFLLLSCQENSTLSEVLSNEEQAIVELEKQIADLKSGFTNTDVTSSRNESYVAATFDIRMEGDNYVIENIEYLTEFEYGFAKGLNQVVNSSSSRTDNEGGGIKVSCDETGDITECPEEEGLGGGMKQAKCVGKAVKACLDGGGCAEVCSMKAEITK